MFASTQRTPCRNFGDVFPSQPALERGDVHARGGRSDVREALANGMAEISVTNTGIGTASEDQDATFTFTLPVRHVTP